MNKKTKKALLAALACSAVFAGAFGLAACTTDEEGGGHTCKWETGWTYDAENLDAGHWHKCEDTTCNKVSGIETHNWGDWTADTANAGHDKRECPDCHAVDSRETPVVHEHVWSTWTIEEGNEPSTEAPGKATRTCSGDDCTATVADKEMTLPKIEKGVYETEVKTELSCTVDGEVEYTYTVGEGDDQVKITFTLTTPSEGEASHTYDENEWKYDSEGHFHLCNGSTHEIDKTEHNTNGENGECSVCGYFGSLTWAVDFGTETTATLENAYVTANNVWRTIVVTGLTSNHQYSITSNSVENVKFKYGFGGGGASYSFTYKEYAGEPEEEKCATVNFTTTGEAGKVTLIITDEGEIVNEPEDITEIATEQEVNFTDVDDAVFYKFTVEQEGSYYLVISFDDALYSDVDFSITVGVALTNDYGEFSIDYADIITDNMETGSFNLSEGTYYVMVQSNALNMSTYGYDPVSGSFKVTTEGSDEAGAITVTLADGGTGDVDWYDGAVIEFSGLTVGATYKLTCDNNGVKFVLPEGGNADEFTFTYAENMKVNVMSMTGADGVHFTLEAVE